MNRKSAAGHLGKHSFFTSQLIYLCGTLASVMGIVVTGLCQESLGSTLSTILSSVFSSTLGSCIVSLLWEIRSKELLAEEMQADFFDKLDSVVTNVEVQRLVEVKGLFGITTNMLGDIDWGGKIAKASTIDACWWSGRTWMKHNSEALRVFFAHGGTMRIIMPNVGNARVIEQMAGECGRDTSELISAHNEARGFLVDLLADCPRQQVQIALAPTVNRYMYLRVHEIVAVAPYPLGRSYFVDTPTSIYNATVGYGRHFQDDFNRFAGSLSFESLGDRI